MLEAFEAAGLYDPASPRAGERAELLAHLVERFGEESVLEAASRVPLFTVAVELTDPEGPRVSARRAAEVNGVPVQDVVTLRSAAGFPVDDVDAEVLPATLIEDTAAFATAAKLFGHDATLSFVRVLGRVSQQVSDAARAVFATAVVEGADDGTVTELELSMSNELAWVAYRTLPAVVEHFLLERADTRQELITRIVEGDLRLAVAFVDLVDSTSWATRTEPASHAAALARFEHAAWEAAVAEGGRLVKLIGDEAMVVADDVDVACRIACGLCALADGDPDLPSARGAVGYGQVVARGGDYYGPVVNLAARAVGEASPGGVVALADAAALLPGDGWHLEPLGSVDLRGVPEPVELVTVARRVGA